MAIGNILQDQATKKYYMISENENGVLRAFLINLKTKYIYKHEFILTEEQFKRSFMVKDIRTIKKIHRMFDKSLAEETIKKPKKTIV